MVNTSGGKKGVKNNEGIFFIDIRTQMLFYNNGREKNILSPNVDFAWQT